MYININYIYICIYMSYGRNYCLRAPCRFTGFPVFTYFNFFFYLCLSIVLKCVHLDPHTWRFLIARVGAHLCFCPCLSGPPSRCLGGLFNQQVMSFGILTAANLKIYPAGVQNFSPITTTYYQHPPTVRPFV